MEKNLPKIVCLKINIAFSGFSVTIENLICIIHQLVFSNYHMSVISEPFSCKHYVQIQMVLFSVGFFSAQFDQMKYSTFWV